MFGDVRLYSHFEGLVCCMVPGAIALIKPEFFLKQFVSPASAESALLGATTRDTAMFLTRFIGMMTFVFGGALYLAAPELKKSTRNKLLALTLLGDFVHLGLVSTHVETLGGWKSTATLGKFTVRGGVMASITIMTKN